MEELTVKDEFDTTQYIVIQMGNEKYGINIAYIDNIVRMQRITRVPKAADYYRGVINLRGEVIPVMDLRIKMGLEEVPETKNTRMIIIKLDNGKIGVIVDEVREVVNLSDSEVEGVTYRNNGDKKATFISGVGKVGADLISLLDINSLVAE